MYVTFLEYFLLQQIKRLNIKRIAVSDHVRGDIPPGGITVPQLSAYPDSFTHGKVLSQLFPLMNLYVSSEPFQSTVNPFMKQVSIQASKTLYTEVTNSWVMFGKLFDNGVVIKTVSKGNSMFHEQLNMLKEYYIGTRLNHLRREIPHFMFTYGYMMCKTKQNKKDTDCGSDGILFDENIIPITTLTRPFPKVEWKGSRMRETLQGAEDYFDKFGNDAKNQTNRLLIMGKTLVSSNQFSKSGGLLSTRSMKQHLSKGVRQAWWDVDPIERQYPRVPYIVLEQVDSMGNLEDFLQNPGVSDGLIKMYGNKYDALRVIAYSLYYQLVFALGMAQERYSFTHCDLHPGNILIVLYDNPTTITYRISGAVYQITTQIVPVIIDFGYSRITDNKVPVNMDALNVNQHSLDGFTPYLDFYKLSATFHDLFKQFKIDNKVFRPFINIFDQLGKPGKGFYPPKQDFGKGMPATQMIYHLSKDPEFKQIVKVVNPLSDLMIPVYWGVSSLYDSLQMGGAGSSKVAKWCKELYGSLVECNKKDTGSVVLNALQTEIINEAMAYVRKVQQKQVLDNKQCDTPALLKPLPITIKQIQADVDGLKVAGQYDLEHVIRDKSPLPRTIVPHTQPGNDKRDLRLPKGPNEPLDFGFYTTKEAYQSAKLLSGSYVKHEVVKLIVQLSKYIRNVSFGEDALSRKYQALIGKVVKKYNWDADIPRLCDYTSADPRGNFMESYKQNYMYLQQFAEHLQYLLHVNTIVAVTTGNPKKLEVIADWIVDTIRELARLFPEMFNHDFLEFLGG